MTEYVPGEKCIYTRALQQLENKVPRALRAFTRVPMTDVAQWPLACVVFRRVGRVAGKEDRNSKKNSADIPLEKAFRRALVFRAPMHYHN